MLKSLLIANRGEIACRIIRTARKLGIETIAVYSQADSSAPHVELADHSVLIGPAPASESYLNGDKIIAAAKETGAEAIHPGYGFLSENASFAQAVLDARIIWVGPPPAAITAMGLKDAAKALMHDAGVPVTPGYFGKSQTLATLRKEATNIGFPVLIKAVAGGGGKGMRKVENVSDFEEALKSCQREARSSFGDDRVLLEKWIENPRHIEVQIFGDTYGNMIHLFERDCTLQRRHQKVIEEAPAPGMDATTRQVICAAAVRAAEAVDYQGAGTIEFIADASNGLSADRIWFMEMNTRLQVEHPVTEMITGVDLVEWQLRIASGEVLPKRQEELSINGWAIEARLYAENPATGFLPSTGRFDLLEFRDDSRVDSGVKHQGEVSPYYDPMIAKIITHNSNRDSARLSLADACADVATWPVHNNAGVLTKLLKNDMFAKAEVTTGFIDANIETLCQPNTLTSDDLAAATPYFAQNDPNDPWSALIGFRLAQTPDKRIRLQVDGNVQTVNLSNTSNTSVKVYPLNDSVVIVKDGWSHLVHSARTDATDLTRKTKDSAIIAPMPGAILSIEAKEGQSVETGQKLATLEAMKMEHALTAPFTGQVSKIHVSIGAQVSEGDLLIDIDPKEKP